uniref:Uncharacterized protein n=1 Tax=Heterorhabditis bacteriophora TaxID=37862 RepID=A0A1I7WDF3_HETBA
MKGEEPSPYRCDCPAILHFRSLFDRGQHPERVIAGMVTPWSRPKVGDKLHLRLNIDQTRKVSSREREIAEVEPERLYPLKSLNCGSGGWTLPVVALTALIVLSEQYSVAHFVVFVIINVKPIPFGVSVKDQGVGRNESKGRLTAAHHGPMGSGRAYSLTNPLGLIEPSSSWFPPKFPQDSWSSGAWLYPVKRMIRGLGGETISTYSQTFNGYDVSVSLLNC